MEMSYKTTKRKVRILPSSTLKFRRDMKLIIFGVVLIVLAVLLAIGLVASGDSDNDPF